MPDDVDKRVAHVETGVWLVMMGEPVEAAAAGAVTADCARVRPRDSWIGGSRETGATRICTPKLSVVTDVGSPPSRGSVNPGYRCGYGVKPTQSGNRGGALTHET